MTTDLTDIGAVLRRARIESGLRQGELATHLGISIWTLNRLEHGKRRFDMDWLPRLPRSVQGPVAAFLSNEAKQRYWHLQNLSRPTLPAI